MKVKHMNILMYLYTLSFVCNREFVSVFYTAFQWRKRKTKTVFVCLCLSLYFISGTSQRNVMKLCTGRLH